MTGWGVVIECLTHDDEEQRRHRRQRELRRQATRGDASRAAGDTVPVRRAWAAFRSAAVCARAYATAGPS